MLIWQLAMFLNVFYWQDPGFLEAKMQRAGALFVEVRWMGGSGQLGGMPGE